MVWASLADNFPDGWRPCRQECLRHGEGVVEYCDGHVDTAAAQAWCPMNDEE